MTVLVNDSPKEVPEASDLAHLLSEIGVESEKGVAVAVNGNVVSSEGWQGTQLFSSDRILVIQATQGG